MCTLVCFPSVNSDEDRGAWAKRAAKKAPGLSNRHSQSPISRHRSQSYVYERTSPECEECEDVWATVF